MMKQKLAGGLTKTFGKKPGGRMTKKQREANEAMERKMKAARENQKRLQELAKEIEEM